MGVALVGRQDSVCLDKNDLQNLYQLYSAVQTSYFYDSVYQYSTKDYLP